MLIYDHNKNFVGIDDDDLRLLGFSTTEELKAACSDIAEFFVKKPGYVHNFKNFQWIDFVLHSDSENLKAIVNTGPKHFACDIQIRPFHLLAEPAAEAYAVTLQHIKPLSAAEAGTPSGPVTESAPIAPVAEPAPVVAERTAEPVIPETPAPVTPPPLHEELPSFDDVAPMPLDEPETVEIPDEGHLHDPYDIPEHLQVDFSKPLEIEDDIFLSESEEIPAPAPTPEAAPELPEVPAASREEKPMLGDYLTAQEKEYAEKLKDFEGYVYDPHIAADELGLPVDLIEEFIGDFINQSHEFHDELTEAAAKGDFENVKLLSHKLKGVAANLRIEDAFEMLSVINNSHDQGEVEAYLKIFYLTVAKLEGKEVPALETIAAPAAAAPAAMPEPEFEPVSEPEPVASFEPAAEIAEVEEDDIYSFDVKRDREAEAPPTEADSEDDDLYELNIPGASAPEEASFEPEEKEADDLYSFDDAELPVSLPEEDEEESTVEETALPELDDDPFAGFNDIGEMPAPEAASETPAMEFDPVNAANEVGLPLDVVTELVGDFAAHAREVKSIIDDAVATGDAALWQHEADQMKGAADNLRMSEIAAELNRLAAAEDAESAAQATETLYGYIDQL